MTGWIYSVFFFFRLLINSMKMKVEKINHSKEELKNRLFNPIYGLRDKNLTEEGIKSKKLAIEGFIGFFGTFIIIMTFISLSKLVGMEW